MNKYTEIHGLNDYDAAVAAGAAVEFTACGGAYNSPQGHGGWIAVPSIEQTREMIEPLLARGSAHRFRAISPAKPSILTRVRRFFVGAKEAA